MAHSLKIIPANEARAIFLQQELEPFLSAAKADSKHIAEIAEKFFKIMKVMNPSHTGTAADLHNPESVAQMKWLESIADTGQAYEAYRNSGLWQVIRSEVLARDGHRCKAGCGKRAILVHHRSYEYKVMAGLDDDKLISLCERCHRFIHFSVSGQKRLVAEWDLALRTLQKRFLKKKRKRRPPYFSRLEKLIYKERDEGLSQAEKLVKQQLEQKIKAWVEQERAGN